MVRVLGSKRKKSIGLKKYLQKHLKKSTVWHETYYIFKKANKPQSRINPMKFTPNSS